MAEAVNRILGGKECIGGIVTKRNPSRIHCLIKGFVINYGMLIKINGREKMTVLKYCGSQT